MIIRKVATILRQLSLVATCHSLPLGSRSMFVLRYAIALPRLMKTSSSTRSAPFVGGRDFAFSGVHANLVLDHVATHLDSYASVNRDARVIVDVGASFGSFALLAERLSPGARILCFEPGRESFELLQRNTRGSERITCSRQALGASDDSVMFSFDPDQPEWSRVSDGGDGYLVEQTTLDSVVEKNHLSSIDLLKIDVEGHESDVLDGAKNALSLSRNVIVETECRNLATVSTVMEDAGFDLTAVGDINYLNGSLNSVDLVFSRNG